MLVKDFVIICACWDTLVHSKLTLSWMQSSGKCLLFELHHRYDTLHIYLLSSHWTDSHLEFLESCIQKYHELFVKNV